MRELRRAAVHAFADGGCWRGSAQDWVVEEARFQLRPLAFPVADSIVCLSSRR